MGFLLVLTSYFGGESEIVDYAIIEDIQKNNTS